MFFGRNFNLSECNIDTDHIPCLCIVYCAHCGGDLGPCWVHVDWADLVMRGVRHQGKGAEARSSSSSLQDLEDVEATGQGP